ncbi:unnamed protein product [Polarella glacialis]|uniref:Uncharacterized protein n=1 Tax=Polarella glacialis TaxID=89957 RepID=A0A813DJV5_POLGL|nr:unnamed protein product [Polarella glacialis]CAE8740097.1 unnamed protein product [Polarella glacialis]
MQLEGLSLLAKGQPQHHAHVYYAPAADGPPASLPRIGFRSFADSEADVSSRQSMRKPQAESSEAALPEPDSPVLSGILARRRQENREALERNSGLQRRHTWADIGLEEKRGEEGTGELAAGVSQRVAALLLPGLKRLRHSVPWQEHGRLDREIASAEHELGIDDDIPKPRFFMVSRRCDQDQSDTLDTLDTLDSSLRRGETF